MVFPFNEIWVGCVTHKDVSIHGLEGVGSDSALPDPEGMAPFKCDKAYHLNSPSLSNINFYDPGIWEHGSVLIWSP